MSKLTTLYNVIKNMKYTDEMKGKFNFVVNEGGETIVKVKKDVFKENGEFKVESDINVSKGECTFNHKSTTEFKGDFGMGPGHGHRFHGMHRGCGHGRMKGHGHDGMREFGPEGMHRKSLKKILFFIKMLDLMEMEKKENGCKTLNIEVDRNTLPNELKEMINERMLCHKHNDMPMKGHGFGKEHQMMKEMVEEYKNFDKLEIHGLINNDDKIDEINIKLIFKNDDDKLLEVQLDGQFD